jgi:hypothetical protein
MTYKVGLVQATNDGATGFRGYGFNITNEDGKRLVTFGYSKEAEADAARPQIVKALIGAIIVVAAKQRPAIAGRGPADRHQHRRGCPSCSGGLSDSREMSALAKPRNSA